MSRVAVGAGEGHTPEPWSFPPAYGSWVYDTLITESDGVLYEGGGTIEVVDDVRFSGPGTLSVSLVGSASDSCALEMDGTFTVSGLVNGSIEFDGSTDCDGCGEATVDGVPAGTVCF